MASSRVGATTSTDTVEEEDDNGVFDECLWMSCDKAGMPKARVLPLNSKM